MLTRMLSEMGLHVGMDCRSKQMESRFFQELNIRLFEREGARWDSPARLHRSLRTEAGRDEVYRGLLEDASDKDVAAYLGTSSRMSLLDLSQLGHAWGWKDPRNSYSWPLWMRLFSDARLVVIFRNGVDVAQSLRMRALKEATNPDTGRIRLVRFKEWLPKHRCMSRNFGFQLWVQYVGENLSAVSALNSSRLYSLRYEDLLADPIPALGEVARFAGLKADPDRLIRATREADLKRAHAFQQDPEMLSFHERKSRHPLMKQLGYDKIGRAMDAAEKGPVVPHGG